MEKPIISITLGDVCGIGPEVIIKSLMSKDVAGLCTPLLIGSHDAVSQAIELTGANLNTKAIKNMSEFNTDSDRLFVFDTGELDPQHIRYGSVSVECGRANGAWLEQASLLCEQGVTGASVMAPITAESLIAAKVDVRSFLATNPTSRYLTLLSGPLRVVHVFDHIMLEDVCRKISSDIVLGAIKKTHDSLKDWGISQPRIGVSGFNPHAHGPQEDKAIIPAVVEANELGIDASGPIAPDTVFRHCIDGRYDVVVAMFHDQGHIAVKTWGFSGNTAIFLGAPYLLLSVGHGSAYDIAGKGVADHKMMQAAILQAASLASRSGFYDH